MTNNDILRRIRYVFDFCDEKIVAIFAHADASVTRAEISDWMKKEDDEAHAELSDLQLALFLNGLIIEKRGAKDGPMPIPEQRLTNNKIFVKLKIALALKAEDVLEILALADYRLSKPELSAFFRKADHKHYRQCLDQVLRNFLQGLQIRFRGQVDVDVAKAGEAT
ncbi:MAG: DUF1456 family protein [Deltaproteobacteria bacterium]|nr:DUF1456 family protein [Deltaproteobacteria bacterium]